MGFLATVGKFFGVGGANTALNGAVNILEKIDGLSTSAEEKAVLRTTVVTAIVAAQATVIQAESTAGGITAKWRPYLMLSFGAVIIAHYVVFPMIAVMLPAAAPVVAALVLHPEMWSLLTLGVGGYIGGRSVEKIIDKVVPNMKLAKMKQKLLGKLSPEEIAELFGEE